MTDLPRLRPYQLEVWRAINVAVKAHDGGSLSVQIARQGGKNEVSAQVELPLLFDPNTGDIIKVAPSLRPQGLISLNRLWSRMLQSSLVPPGRRDGHAIEFSGSLLLLLSAETGANVLGHTAGALMEVDEALLTRLPPHGRLAQHDDGLLWHPVDGVLAA